VAAAIRARHDAQTPTACLSFFGIRYRITPGGVEQPRRPGFQLDFLAVRATSGPPEKTPALVLRTMNGVIGHRRT